MKTERVLVILFLIGILFKFFHWTGFGLILTIACFSTAIIYCPFSFYFFSDKSLSNQNLPLSIISGFFLSIVPLGILFKIQYWNGAQIQLGFGLIITPIFLIIALIMKNRAPEAQAIYYRNLTLRFTVLTSLTYLFYFTSTATLLKIQYHDDPKLGQLKILYYENPTEIKYQEEINKYIERRDSLEKNQTK